MISIFQGDNSDITETMLNDFLIKNYECSLTNIEVKGISEFLKEIKGL